MTYRNVGGCYNDIQEYWEVVTMTYRNVGRLLQ